jgi:polyhydroxybutyrate depolymerase
LFQGLNTKGLYQDWFDLLGGGRSNTGADDVGFVASLIEWAITNRNVNPRRVYVTGISNGGCLTQRLIIERPELFAAAGAVGASLPARDVPIPTRGTPLILIHGTSDVRVPWSGGPVTQNRGIVRSAEDTRDFFIMVNQAGWDYNETILPDQDPKDDCRMVSQYYPHPTTPVQFYQMVGGGHMTPGIDIPAYIANCGFETVMGNFCNDAEGAQLIWDFMFQFTQPST